MEDSKSSGGMGILGVLLIIFVTLKCLAVAPVAAWSWGVVLIPLWIFLGLVLTLVFISAVARDWK